jgi:hypothetical protein
LLALAGSLLAPRSLHWMFVFTRSISFFNFLRFSKVQLIISSTYLREAAVLPLEVDTLTQKPSSFIPYSLEQAAETMAEQWIGYTVSINCGTVMGTFKGVIARVEASDQSITLRNAARNGEPCTSKEITIR